MIIIKLLQGYIKQLKQVSAIDQTSMNLVLIRITKLLLFICKNIRMFFNEK